MSRTFDLFHLSLIGREQRDLFVPERTREQWIRVSLSEPFSFVHRRREFHWVPKSWIEGDVIGIVERLTSHPKHRSPAEGGAEVVEQEWQGAVVVVDPTTHELGQRVALEQDRDVGAPRAVLSSLLTHINYRTDAPFTIEMRPVWEGDTFWAFANKHNNVLRRITFDFVVPNMWGATKNLDRELRGTGEDTGAQTVKVTLGGTDGVKADSQRVRDGVEYGERGGATITARAIDGDKYSSNEKISSSKISDDEIEAADQTDAWKRLAAKILRRE